mmetsp:Transcript_52299/g.131345  ORF Transcript_52299/g.131345 Transcript_52299/m.131345 type:complete len:434 (+) Transcript_52299:65-1366(+)
MKVLLCKFTLRNIILLFCLLFLPLPCAHLVFLETKNHNAVSLVGTPVQHQPLFDVCTSNSFVSLNVSTGGKYFLTEKRPRNCSKLVPWVNSTNCGPEGKVHIYPYSGEVHAGSLERDYANILDVVSKTVDLASPRDACYFIPSLNTLCSWDTCRIARESLSSLKHWYAAGGPGINHIVFYIGDNTNIPLNTGKAMRAVSSTSFFNFRPGHDIAIPINLVYRCHMTPPTFQALPPTFRRRKYFLTFKGARYPAVPIRTAVKRLHNGRDVVICTYCEYSGIDCESKETRRLGVNFDGACVQDNKESKKCDFKDLLVNTTFSLVVAGAGTHSYRLLEVLRAGSIPVVVDDEYVFPFSELIDWRKIAVRMEVSQLDVLMPTLRAIPEKSLDNMREEGVRVHEEYFKSTEKIIQAIQMILKRRASLNKRRASLNVNHK